MYADAVASTIARDDVLRALECPKCRALVAEETTGDAEHLGELVALGGASEEGLYRHHLARTFPDATHRTCATCFRSITFEGTTLWIDVLRPRVPRLDCPRCAAFLDAHGTQQLAHRALRVEVPPEEPARSYGLFPLAADDLRCPRCRRSVRAFDERGVRRVSIELVPSDGPIGTPPGPPLEEGDAERRIPCERCRGFLREVARAGLHLVDDGKNVGFVGGSVALLVSHFGAKGDLDRTCSDCHRQAWLAAGTNAEPVRNGIGRLELEPGGIGPHVDGCRTCEPIVRRAIASARSIVPVEKPRHVRLPIELWDDVAARFHLTPRGDSACCAECGRDARVVRYWAWPVELGLHARPEAARSRRPHLECARCEGFVAAEDFPVVEASCIRIRLPPEPTYGAPLREWPGRPSGAAWECTDCGREIRVLDDGYGHHTEVDLVRGPRT